MKTSYFELTIGFDMPRFGKSKNISAFIVLILFTIQMAWSQNYTTTGLSLNWQDAAAWTCQGGPCNQNPFPDNDISNSTVEINHDINYGANNPIKLNNKAILIVSNNAKLSTASNINVNT
ncbi:MAG: hypothetical protein KJN85_08865, partial [Maribacter sp.]|nr:hypothetical protein [Maribacter sp.]